MGRQREEEWTPSPPPPQTWSWLSGHSRRGDTCSRLWIFTGVLGPPPTMQGPCMFFLAQGLPASPACPSFTPRPYPRLASGLRFPPDAGGGGLEKSSQAPPLPMSSPPREAQQMGSPEFEMLLGHLGNWVRGRGAAQCMDTWPLAGIPQKHCGAANPTPRCYRVQYISTP